MARYFDVHPQDPQPHRIAQVVAMLRDDALIAYPTDSSYALGCRWTTSSTLSNAAGKKYTAAGPYVGAVGKDLDENQPPGTAHSGWFVFDVPESVTMPKTLNVKSDPQPGTTNPPTLVRFG
jgi:hypothetical protein